MSRPDAKTCEGGAEFCMDPPTPAATSATPLTGFDRLWRSLGSRSTQPGMTFPVRRLQNDRENEQQFLDNR